MKHRTALLLWLSTASAYDLRGIFHRELQQDDKNDPAHIWGYQQGAANAHSDAGAMVYDAKRDQVILVGTTHDNQFFDAAGANGVDCFIATIKLPDVTQEINAKDAAAEHEQETGSLAAQEAAQVLAEVAEQQRVPWELSGKHRVATPNTLDRCDLIASLLGDHDHVFVGGTLAVTQNSNKDPLAVQPMLYETNIKNYMGGNDKDTVIETGRPLQVFEAPAFGTTVNGNPLTMPKKNDIIIPALMTAHAHDIYIASIHRVLVLSEEEVGSSNAAPKLQISLGIAKFQATENATAPLVKEWSHLEPTSILEVKTDGVPHVTSGMFHHGPGALTPQEQHEIESLHNDIDSEIEEIEQEEEEYEEEQMQMDMHRHQYQHDGVLISGLEVVEVSATESYLLIAGSAPGMHKDKMGTHNNHSNTDNHPFMPHAPGYKTSIGDWDGYVAKLNPRTGEVAQTNDLNINTWGYRFHTQPQRSDFIQSLCVPKIRNEVLPSGEKFYTSVAYAVGTTQGKLEGDQFGGAFILQIDLTSMEIHWKQQIPGMNVHGMSCEVLVDTASHGETIRAQSKDLIYIAGEVHGQMKVPMADGTEVLTHGHGETDVFVAQLRASDGKINWVQQIGTDQQDRLAKNINNPSVSDGQQETDIGETGSGKGALVLDRQGNAIIYGTTNGSLGRTKGTGDRFRDIFVVRLHRHDGSYKAIVEPHTFITEHTPAPIGSGGPASTTSPAAPATPVSAIARPAPASPTVVTHKGAITDTSTNVGVIVLGLAVPVVLGIIILLATNRRSAPVPMEMTSTPMGSDLHVPFPCQDSSPPSASFPPGVEQSLEMSPTNSQPATESFGVL